MIKRRPRRKPRLRKNSLQNYALQYRQSLLPGVKFNRFSEEDLKIIDLGLFYQQVRREKTGTKFYETFYPRTVTIGRGKNKKRKVLSPKENVNWKWFKKAYQIIKDNHYDMREFIIAQFEEMENWEKFPIPTPRSLTQVAAIDRYDRWKVKKNRKKLLEERPLLEAEKIKKAEKEFAYLVKEMLKNNNKEAVIAWLEQLK
ncbi:MAG: hypothetical protein ACTSPV_05220 [Candidatus Hodarchaeales archaeon]